MRKTVPLGGFGELGGMVVDGPGAGDAATRHRRVLGFGLDAHARQPGSTVGSMVAWRPQALL